MISQHGRARDKWPRLAIILRGFCLSLSSPGSAYPWVLGHVSVTHTSVSSPFLFLFKKYIHSTLELPPSCGCPLKVVYSRCNCDTAPWFLEYTQQLYMPITLLWPFSQSVFYISGRRWKYTTPWFLYHICIPYFILRRIWLITISTHITNALFLFSQKRRKVILALSELYWMMVLWQVYLCSQYAPPGCNL